MCKWLSPTDLLLCVSPLSQAWHQASLSDEVWKPLLDLHFPLQTAVEVRTMCQFRAFSEASYLPVIYQNTLYRLHLNGRMDKLDLKSGKPHRWWTFTSLLTIGVLPSFQLFIHLPESALAIILDELTLGEFRESVSIANKCLSVICQILFPALSESLLDELPQRVNVSDLHRCLSFQIEKCNFPEWFAPVAKDVVMKANVTG